MLHWNIPPSNISNLVLYLPSTFGGKIIFVLGSIRFNQESMDSIFLHCLHIFNSAKRFPSIPVTIKFSIINKSFCLCCRRCAVVSPIDRFFCCINFQVWAIQEGVTLCFKAWTLLENSGLKQLISGMWASIIYRRWCHVVVVMPLWSIISQIWFFSCVP